MCVCVCVCVCVGVCVEMELNSFVRPKFWLHFVQNHLKISLVATLNI